MQSSPVRHRKKYLIFIFHAKKKKSPKVAKHHTKVLVCLGLQWFEWAMSDNRSLADSSRVGAEQSGKKWYPVFRGSYVGWDIFLARFWCSHHFQPCFQRQSAKLPLHCVLGRAAQRTSYQLHSDIGQCLKLRLLEGRVQQHRPQKNNFSLYVPKAVNSCSW